MGDLESRTPANNTRFLGATRPSIPNGMSIGSAVFTGLTIVTDRQTDGEPDRQTTL